MNPPPPPPDTDGIMRRSSGGLGGLAIAALIAFACGAFVLMVLAGCARTHIEGDCEYTREVAERYVCKPDGKLDDTRVLPPP